jgi:hypothetical protein
MHHRQASVAPAARKIANWKARRPSVAQSAATANGDRISRFDWRMPNHEGFTQ